MRRTDLMDTSEKAHRKLVELLRSATPERRAQLTISHMHLGFEMHRLAMERVATQKAAKS